MWLEAWWWLSNKKIVKYIIYVEQKKTEEKSENEKTDRGNKQYNSTNEIENQFIIRYRLL